MYRLPHDKVWSVNPEDMRLRFALALESSQMRVVNEATCGQIRMWPDVRYGALRPTSSGSSSLHLHWTCTGSANR